jgi:hypothetical protein
MLLFFLNRAICEIMWKNIVEPDKPQLTNSRMRFACWIPMATGTHSEYLIFIAFLLQQWLHNGASMLSYTYIACLAYLTTLSASHPTCLGTVR